MPDSSPEDAAVSGTEDNEDVKSPSAESSPAASETDDGLNQGAEPKDMLSAVRRALEPEEEETPASGDDGDPKPEPDPDADKEGDDEGEDDGDFTEDELDRLKPKTKRRFEQLLSERAELKPKAEQFDKMVEWINERELTDQDVNLLFNVGANLRSGNFREAYDQIEPIYRQLQQALGETLPDELQQRVQTGQIDEASARQLAATQANSQIAQRKARRLEEQAERARAQETQQQHLTAVKSAVSDWENAKRGADPDWNLKQARVTALIELAVYRQGLPKTAKDAVAMADDALKHVEGELRQLRPRKPEVKPTPDAGSGRTEAQPQTLLEAAKAGLAKAHSGG